METPNRKRRPVLIVSRDAVIEVLNNVVVAPVTSSIRDIPTCIPVGADEGIDHDSVATFDNLAAVPKSVQSGHRRSPTDLRSPERHGRLLNHAANTGPPSRPDRRRSHLRGNHMTL